MTTTLRDANRQDAALVGQQATIVAVAPDSGAAGIPGTVTIDLGGGRLVPDTIVLGSYAPVQGDVVEVLNRDENHWIVLGPRRTTNPAAQSIAAEWLVAYDVSSPVTAANPLVVDPVATGSWRPADGWSGAYLPTADTVAQGAYSTQFGYYRGCYFYGPGVFSALAGRRCTRLRIRVHRLGSGGSAGATQQVIGPHPHATQPAGEPYFPWGAINVGALAWGATATFDLPASWGDLLVSGAASGLGHALLATGNGNQSYAAGRAADGQTGRVTVDWS